MSEDRRHPRIDYSGLVFIAWQTFQGERNHVLGRCLDVSEQGIGLALYKRIPVGSFVKVRAYALNLDCSAIVRHCAMRAGRYTLGLELSEPVSQDVLDELYATQIVASATA
jgi:hypothetical protein